MNRRRFLAATGASSVLAPLAAPAEPSGPGEKAVPPLVLSPPVVMAPRADGAELVWAVSRLSRGKVVARTPEGERVFRAGRMGFSAQGDKVLRVRLAGLPSGTEIQYEAITESGIGESETVRSGPRTFRTLDPGAAATRFVVWNDTHQNPETLRGLDEKSPGADFMIWNGDTCNDWHEEGLIAPTLLHPAGCDFTSKRPLHLVWGNHDVRGRWGFRVPDYVATPEGKPYYGIRSGPVAAICLHTGEDKADDHPSFAGRADFQSLREEQARWMKHLVETDPAFRDAPYRVVFCHIPMRWTDETTEAGYDWFSKRSRDLWHPVLVSWKTQVVISGHTHREAWIPASTDFPYAQMVGGGPKPEAARWIEGMADARSLRLAMRDLGGRMILEKSFPPLV